MNLFIRKLYKKIGVKEKNYLIFQFKGGEDQCSCDSMGEVLDGLGMAADDVFSLSVNPLNDREFEVLFKGETIIYSNKNQL